MLLTEGGERIIAATNLAQMKMTEARSSVEQDGFQQSDVYESGDFDELGDELLDVEFGQSSRSTTGSTSCSEVDIDMLGDLASAASSLPMGGDEGAGDAAAGGRRSTRSGRSASGPT